MAMRHRNSSAGFVIAGLTAGVLIVAGLAVVQTTEARESDEQGATTQRKAPKCLDMTDVGRIHVVDDHTLIVYDHAQNPYQLDVGGPCRSMNDMSRIGFEINGNAQLCRAHDAMILYSHDTESPVRCIVNGVKSISREEADRLDPA